MKNKEFWKGAVAGALVVTCIGTGVFAGDGRAIQRGVYPAGIWGTAF